MLGVPPEDIAILQTLGSTIASVPGTEPHRTLHPRDRPKLAILGVSDADMDAIALQAQARVMQLDSVDDLPQDIIDHIDDPDLSSYMAAMDALNLEYEALSKHERARQKAAARKARHNAKHPGKSHHRKKD